MQTYPEAEYVGDQEREYGDTFINKFNTWRNGHSLKKPHNRFLDRITIDMLAGSNIPRSSVPLSAPSIEAMANALLDFHHIHQDRREHQFWLGTICLGIGVCPIDDVNFDLKAFNRKIIKLMVQHRLHGVFRVEPVFVLPYIVGQPVMVSFHAHLACWHIEEKLRPKKLPKAIMLLPSVSNPYGKAVDFKPCDMSARHIAGLGKYIFKLPRNVELLMPDPLQPGKFYMKKSREDFTPELIARMVEILSHMPFYASVRGVGEGTEVRKAWKAAMVRWEKRNGLIEMPATADVTSAWYDLHRHRATPNWRSPQIRI